MKMYTNSNQTAKLIELGFEKPKNTQYIQRAKARNLHSPFIEFGEPEFEGSYTIGELIEMLPKEIDYKGFKNILYIFVKQGLWNVEYSDFVGELHLTYRSELIDALYDMVVQLKKAGVI